MNNHEKLQLRDPGVIPTDEVLEQILGEGDDWICGYILSCGEYAQVIEPLHIRGIIKDKAQKIIEK